VENNTCQITNVAHWPLIVAEDLAKDLELEKFMLINDFEANG
jgi:glucokinase